MRHTEAGSQCSNVRWAGATAATDHTRTMSDPFLGLLDEGRYRADTLPTAVCGVVAFAGIGIHHDRFIGGGADGVDQRGDIARRAAVDTDSNELSTFIQCSGAVGQPFTMAGMDRIAGAETDPGARLWKFGQ